MSRRLALVLGLALAAGCGGPRPPATVGAAAPPPDAPASLADDLPRLAERTAAMFEALATALEGPADCAVLTARVQAVMAEHQEVRAATTAVAERERGPDLDTALAPHAARIAAAAGRMAPALRACGGDPAFAAALAPEDD
jgi:hypothetical protein